MNNYLSTRSAVLSLLALAFVDTPRLAADTPVQVYIMMGQSNMLGMGTVAGTTDGTLQYAVQNKGKYQYLVDGAGNWAVRDDVRNVRVMSSALDPMTVYNNQWMSVAAESDGKIGPEYGIGKYLGDAVDAPVMLLKSCIGNRSLGWDLLPPGSQQYQYNDGTTNWTYAGYGDYDNRWSAADPYDPTDAGGWRAGVQWDGDIRNVKTVLSNLGTYFPGATQYEIAGFFWWQGDKDRYDAAYATRYEQNLVHLIEQLRIEFNAPNANFVCATLGQTVLGSTSNMNEKFILDAQLAVEGDAGKYPGYTGKYPQFEDNVATVYSHPLSLGGASNNHYNNNAETYMNVGEAMGQAMVSLLRTLPYVTVDQQTGTIKIVNPADGDLNMAFKDLSITSAVGALNPANWTAITGNYDLAGDGSVDGDGNWTVTTATTGELSEAAQVGGSDGLISVAHEVSLGVGAWVQNFTKDLKFTYTDANGIARALTVRYVGTNTPAADLNFDGTVDALDWPVFLNGNHRNLSGLSAAQAYHMGDLDGDGDNDIHDFALFREAFEAMHPAAGAFEAMVASYAPEPGSALLLAAGAAGLGLRRRRRARTAHELHLRKPGGGVRRKSMVAGCSGRSLLSMAAAAMAAVTFTAASANAATMTNSPTPPTIDGLDIASYGTTTGSDKWWPDVATSYGNPGKTVGQTFTTGSQGVRLNAITFQVTSGTQPTKTYAIRVGEVSGATFTTIASESATQGFVTANNDYWTWTLDTPVSLFPDTVYGVDVGFLSSTSSWETGIPYVYYTANVYSGGTSFRSGTAGNGIGDSSITATNADRVFHLDLTAAAPPVLTLRVDPVTGATAMRGHSSQSISFSYYEITSAAGSLDSSNWVSLADQDFEGHGPANGSGNGWEEAGGAGSGALAEAYLLGDSTIGTGQSVSLGNGYDPDVGAEDLVFTYLTDSGKVIEGLVEYVTSVIAGDANWDGIVDAADYIALKRNFGRATGARYKDGDFNGDHDVDWNDLQTLMGNFGARGVGSAPAAPEPATLGLLALLALSLPKRGALALIRRGSRVR